MAVEVLFYKIELNNGSHKNPKWRWIASARYQRDAEQLMFRYWLDKPRRVIASDGSRSSYIPFGKLGKDEFE